MTPDQKDRARLVLDLIVLACLVLIAAISIRELLA